MRGVYQGFTTNDEGQVITGATVEVRLPGGSLATIYSAQTGGSSIANPLAVDANGYFRFYADPGLYSVGAFIGATQLADFDDVVIVGAVATDDVVPVVRGGTGGTTATVARTNLGLGTAAVANTGTALANVPTNQNLMDGVARLDDALFGKPVHQRAIGAANNARYLLLALIGSGSDYVSGKLIGRRVSGSGAGLSGAEVEIHLKSQGAGTAFLYSLNVLQGAVTDSQVEIVRITVAGQDWIALDVVSIGTSSPFSNGARFDGTAQSTSPLQLTWVLPADAVVVESPYTPAGAIFRYVSPGYFKCSATGKFGNVAGLGALWPTQGHVFQNNANQGTVFSVNENTGSGTQNFASYLATGATGVHLRGNVNNVVTVSIAANGNITNTNNSYGAISDLKLKTDITDVPSYWDKYKLVRWVNYLLANDPSGADQKLLGVIAQEVQGIFPGLIESTPDIVEVQIPAVLDEEGEEIEPARTESQETGEVTLSVKYSVLGHISDCVVQEAQARIESLEAQLLALAGRVEALES